MGEIRIVGPGKTRGYPYPICKKKVSPILRDLYQCMLIHLFCVLVLLLYGHHCRRKLLMSFLVLIYFGTTGRNKAELSVLQLGDASIEVTELLCSGESIPSATFFTKYDNYISRYKKYSAALSEMEAVGGFEYAAKIGRFVDFLMYNA